ncbi:SLC2A5 [Branchiostoma lanceolatum]|uniref:SLC2A5 protein n=1 Tax=Branchiostoma lanceolatum TaxID=7740 RepID=A0A8J9ZB05_BRALA|nr:SLC2A5 [Branchiostoma lanceolatum]
MSKTANRKMTNGGSKAEEQSTDGRMTFLLFMSVLISAFGSTFQYGYSTSVVNAPAELMQDFYKKSFYNFTGGELADDSLTVLWSTTVSIYTLGGLIGSLLVGPLASKIGRKGAILISNIFSLSGAALMFGARFANSYHMIILGRTIVGIHNILQKLRGEENVEAVLDDMRVEHEKQKKEPTMQIFALLKSRTLRSQLICCVLIFFYSTSIYEKAGVPKEYSPYATIGTGAINVFMTIVSVLVIDITGRKVLLTWPLVFMTLAFGILTVTQGLSEYLYCVCGCSQGITPNGTLVGDVCHFVNETGAYE